MAVTLWYFDVKLALSATKQSKNCIRNTAPKGLLRYVDIKLTA